MRRIALYSHDAQGLGHMRRNMAIAETLANGEPCSILLIAGAREVAHFPLPPGVDTLALPALSKDSRGGYRARSLGLGHDAIVALRSQILNATLGTYAPDVLVVDKLPTGVEGELAASFGVLRAAGTRVVLGMREVLDEPDRVRADWRRSGALAALRAYYDAIWVYGDRQVYDPVAEYGMPRDIAALVRYTGYLGRPVGERAAAAEAAAWRQRLDLRERPLFLCVVGGGEDGYRLAHSFAAAELPDGGMGIIVTGPFMPAAQQNALTALARGRPDLRVIDFVPDADALVRLADRVIAMGGYNTSCEILGSGRPALIVPRIRPRQEQLIRAQRLSELGAVDMLMPDALSPGTLSSWLAAGALPRPAVPPIDLSGLSRLPGLLEEVLASTTPRLGHSKAGHSLRPSELGLAPVPAWG